jgi:1,2-diacylglycerol 3-alpha-glucosyltransferase
MRILMMSHGYPPTISGVSIVAQKLSRAMVGRGHEVAVLTASDRREAYVDEDNGIELIRVRSIPNPFWADGPIPLIGNDEAEEVIESFQPDIVHVHDGSLLSFRLLRKAEAAGIPLLATAHFLPRFIFQYVNLGSKLETIADNIAWEISVRLLNPFDHVVFPTKTQQRLFQQNGLTVPSTVISNGVDTCRYHPGETPETDLEGWTSLPEGQRILFVGRIAKDKDIEVLIQAMPDIWAEQRAHLLLVGRGNDRGRLEELAFDLGVSHCVHFLGFVPESDLPALYRNVDVFAIASICEVQSIPTLQAAATALPIVAVNEGALPELTQQEQNGFLVEAGQPEAMGKAIVRVLQDKARAQRMGQMSLRIAQMHDEGETYRAHEHLYRGLIESSRQPIEVHIGQSIYVDQVAEY